MDPLLPPQPPVPLPTATTNAAASTAARTTVEASHNQISHLAGATATTTQSFNHPPYAEMIYAAITALKEREGSSKRAISKYIEREYTGIPPTHSALLTHHLKRLKNSGFLVMVKKSYMLPRSDLNSNNDPTAASPQLETQPQTQPQLVVSASTSSPSGPKRGRGRPPKPRTNSLADTGFQPIVQPQPDDGSYPIAEPAAGVQPVLIAVGLADEPTADKRGPGRPKKVLGQGDTVAVPAKKGRGRPPNSASLGSKKRPGRPKTLSGIKKRPGRPPKSVVVPYATVTAEGNEPRPRGRPKKPEETVDVGGVVLVPAKRPGRPPKAGGIEKPNKSAGRPVGRPKKNGAQLPQQAEAYGDLKRKLEFFQSRVKQAVGVLKPQLTSESAVSAVAVIQELEGLASMDIINAPARDAPQPSSIFQT